MLPLNVLSCTERPRDLSAKTWSDTFFGSDAGSSAAALHAGFGGLSRGARPALPVLSAKLLGTAVSTTGASFAAVMVPSASSQLLLRIGDPFQGRVVSAILPNSLYDRLGIKNGDVVIRIDDKAPSSPLSGLLRLRALRDETRMTLTITRQGKSIEIATGEHTSPGA